MVEFKRVVKDESAIIDILDSLRDAGLHYVVVPKVKIRNRLHRNQQQIKDVILMARESYRPFRPMALLGIYDMKDDTFYLSHLDITHWNMSEDIESTGFGTYTIYYRQFCNQVTQSVIIDEPRKARAILTGNLMAGNPNDAYRTPQSVDVDTYTKAIHYQDTGDLIPSTASPLNILLRASDIGNLSTSTVNDTLAKAKAELASGREYVCCAVIRKPEDLYSSNYLRYRWLTEEERNNPNTVVSEYYPVITKDNFDIENIEISRAEYDVICCGCGSAGSQILDQIARLNYYEKYYLVDMDTVERKNLRNQVYTRGDINGYKTDGLRRFIEHINDRAHVKTSTTRVENVLWTTFKAHILINGFDNIDARLFMLEKVTSGELLADYIVDARYDGLSADLFMVDTTKPDEVNMYKELLLADKEVFDKEKAGKLVDLDNLEELKEWLRNRNVFSATCGETQRRYFGRSLCNYRTCGSYDCVHEWQERFKSINAELFKDDDGEGCVAQNIIHIYKLVSTWVTSNIVSLETDNKKLFTHVMCTVDPLPKSIVVKK